MVRNRDLERPGRLTPWLTRISDDVWGATQLLALFFLGATVLCVPPRLHASAAVEPVAGLAVAAAPVQPPAGGQSVTDAASPEVPVAGAPRRPGTVAAVR